MAIREHQQRQRRVVDQTVYGSRIRFANGFPRHGRHDAKPGCVHRVSELAAELVGDRSQGVIHVVEVHVEARLRHAGSLRDALGGQRHRAIGHEDLHRSRDQFPPAVLLRTLAHGLARLGERRVAATQRGRRFGTFGALLRRGRVSRRVRPRRSRACSRRFVVGRRLSCRLLQWPPHLGRVGRRSSTRWSAPAGLHEMLSLSSPIWSRKHRAVTADHASFDRRQALPEIFSTLSTSALVKVLCLNCSTARRKTFCHSLRSFWLSSTTFIFFAIRS